MFALKMQTSGAWLTLMLCVFTLLLVYHVDMAHGYTTMGDLDKLIKEKKAGYNKLLRPKYNQSDPLYIAMAFDLIAIRDFDEVAEKFSVVGTVYSIWRDDRMVWDPEEYGDLYTFLVENTDFWTPSFIVVNAFDKFEKVGADSYWPIRFYHSGDAVFHPGQVFTTTCSVNVALYPWDTQTCNLLFTVWGNGKEEIILVPFNGYDKVSLTYYGSNGEWELIDTKAETLDFNLFQFEFTMKRKPLFILVNTLVPIILMSVLNILAFLIPVASGERISYCITVLLAVAVFLTLIGDTMPRSATTIAVLCYYLVCVLALSMLIIVASVISMRIYHWGENEQASPCWAAFVRFLRCRCRRKRSAQRETSMSKRPRYPTGSNHTSDYLLYKGNGTIESRNGVNHNRINTISQLTHESEKVMSLNGLGMEYPETNLQNGRHFDYRESRIREDNVENEMITWCDVSTTLDMVFFVLALICLAIFTGVFFIYTLASSS